MMVIAEEPAPAPALADATRNTVAVVAAYSIYAPPLSIRPTTLSSARPDLSKSRLCVSVKSALDGWVGVGVVVLLTNKSCTVVGEWSHATHRRMALSNTNERMDTPANSVGGRNIVTDCKAVETNPADPTMPMPGLEDAPGPNAAYSVLLGLPVVPKLCMCSARKSVEGSAAGRTTWKLVDAPLLATARMLLSPLAVELPLSQNRRPLKVVSATADANDSEPSSLGVV